MDSLPSSTKHASTAVLICVFSSMAIRSCDVPNIPMMVTPGHPQSFPSTKPFDLASAQYVIQGAVKIGVVISNLTFGYLSGKIGFRITFVTLMLGQAVFTVGKYFASGSFWAYTALNFGNGTGMLVFAFPTEQSPCLLTSLCLLSCFKGLFGSAAAVGNGYMGMLYHDQRVKADAFIGYCMAAFILGAGIGSLLTLCFPRDLFAPLIFGACLNVVAFFIALKFVLNPKKDEGIDDQGETNRNNPQSIIMRPFINIVAGAFADNIGSLGVFPLALSPVMYEVYFLNFVEKGLPPVMSENEYRLIFSMIGFVAIPSALASPICFKKFGAACLCVVANILTAIFIVAMLHVANSDPVTKGSFVLYVCILYIGFPLTLISNLSTGPMLDRVTSFEKKTVVQGVNMAIFDVTNSFFLIVLGLIADNKGNSYMMWVCFGISVFAAIVNLPLLFESRLGRSLTVNEIEETTSEDQIDKDNCTENIEE